MTEEVSPLEMLAVEHGAWFDEDGDIGMTAESLDAFVEAAIKQEREAPEVEAMRMLWDDQQHEEKEHYLGVVRRARSEG